MPRRDRSPLADTVERRRRRRRARVLKAPAQGRRAVEDKAHGRPLSTRSLIFNPPSVRPFLVAMMPAIARRAFSRLKLVAAATRRATGLLRRVMTISSPCAAWPSGAGRWWDCVRAAWAMGDRSAGGLSRTGVLDICGRYAECGLAGAAKRSARAGAGERTVSEYGAGGGGPGDDPSTDLPNSVNQCGAPASSISRMREASAA